MLVGVSLLNFSGAGEVKAFGVGYAFDTLLIGALI